MPIQHPDFENYSLCTLASRRGCPVPKQWPPTVVSPLGDNDAQAEPAHATLSVV